MPTRSLARWTPPLRWDVETLGRLDRDGRIAWEPGAFPPAGPCMLVLWTPGAVPQFRLARGALRREGARWRFDAPAVAADGAFIVLVEPS